MQVLADEAAVAIDGLTRRQTLAIGRDHDRRAVLVGAADHQDVVAPQPVIPGGDVRRNAEAGDMPQMPWATRVGPRDGDENALLSTVREGVPPGRARSRTSYGGALARTDAGRPAAGDADRRRRAPRVRSRPRPSGIRSIRLERPGRASHAPASHVASRRPGACARRAADAPAAPALRVRCTAGRSSERAPRTTARARTGARGACAEPALSGTAASASGSQAHALSRDRGVAADRCGHTCCSPRPHAGAVGRSATTGVTRRHRRSRSLHRRRLLDRWHLLRRLPGRQKRQGVDVAVRVRREADAQIDVRLRPLGLAARADRADDVALADLSPDGHPDRAQVDERDRPAVLGSDRQAEALSRQSSGERDHSARGGTDVGARGSSDVDPSMLATRIRIALGDERPQHRPVDRPGPRRRCPVRARVRRAARRGACCLICQPCGQSTVALCCCQI